MFFNVRSTIVGMTFSSSCEKFLEKIGISVDWMKDAAMAVNVEIGNSSQVITGSLIQSVDPSGGVYGMTSTIEQYMQANPSTDAIAQFGGNNVYINAITFAQRGESYALATLMHELMHNLGFGDKEIQRKAGLPNAASQNITFEVMKQCQF
jgi:hypothetical protein